MTVQPIRLFGDPVLRTPAAPVTTFDAELRKLVADLTDTMHDEGGAGLAAPQLGVGLRVFTYDCDEFSGHLVNPTFDVVGDEEQVGPEGCLSIPGLSWECRRHLHVVARGWNQHGEPVDRRGQRAAGALHPARGRPPRRRAVRRPARRRHPQGRDGRDPRRRVVRRAGAGRGQGRARTRSSGRPGSGVRLVFAGTPEPAVPSLAALLGSPRHEVVAVVDPPRRPERSRPHAAPLAGRCIGRRGGRAGAHPRRARATPTFLAALRDLGPDCCPVVAYGALVPRAALDVPRARLGQPPLLPAARLAGGRAGAGRAPPRRRDHRRHHLPAGGRPRHGPGVRRGHRGRARRRHRRGAPAPARGVRRHPALGHARRHRRRQPHPASAAVGRRLARPEGDGGRRARRTGRRHPSRSTGSSAR